MGQSSALPRAKSCVECRQQKVRCDRALRHPRPCTRCAQYRVPCTYRPHFIRSRKRNRLNTDQQASAHMHINHSLGSHTNLVNSEHGSAEEQPSRRPELSPSIGNDVSIEDVVLDATEVSNYFAYFIINMHVHFPFLGTPFPIIEKILDTSPLLFWTIITISCSFRNRALYRALQPCVRKLVTQTLYPFSLRLETCQALCLLCLWPFEADEPNDDPVFVYAGMATHFALHMGLHRPQHSHEFRKINSATEPCQSSTSSKLLTWYACIFIEHQLASKTGVPSGIRDYHQLQQQLASNTVPAVSPLITQHVLLACVRERFLTAIAWDGPSPSGLAEPHHRLNLLSLFSRELQRISAEKGSLDRLTQVLLHASHVAVGGFTIAADLLSLDGHTDAAACQVLIQQGVDSASALLDLVTPLAWETLPTHILRAVLHSGVFAGQVRRTILTSVGPNGHTDVQEQRHEDLLDAPILQSSSCSHIVSPIPIYRLDQIIDRSLGLLQTLAYGTDFPTRGKIVLEALQHQGQKYRLCPQPSGPDHNDQAGRLSRSDHPIAMSDTSQSACAHRASQSNPPPATESRFAGVQFRSRMAANFYWDAVEHEKGLHNWDQDERRILEEVMSNLR